jgi:hypothetical protein
MNMQIGFVGADIISWDWVTGEVYVALEYAGQATTEAQALAVARHFAAYPCRCLLRKYA